MQKQTQLASLLKINASNITEAKNRNTFPLGWALKIARRYNLNTDWLLTGQGPMRNPSPALKAEDGEGKYQESLEEGEGEWVGDVPEADDYDSVQYEERVKEHNAVLNILKYILKNADEAERHQVTGALHELYYKIKSRNYQKKGVGRKGES